MRLQATAAARCRDVVIRLWPVDVAHSDQTDRSSQHRRFEVLNVHRATDDVDELAPETRFNFFPASDGECRIFPHAVIDVNVYVAPNKIMRASEFIGIDRTWRCG